jgi:UDP-N-acetylglucosamine--N-acetylmuramyl-(pentapeptide) pyrophosphoryl-undecaprenol N-acetylglucosamine transferase
MNKRHKKLIFAAGGTGGHLFPAQALAEQLQKNNKDLELLFAGAKLSSNAYFEKTQFAFRDISSATPFGKNLLKAFRSFFSLLKGIRESYTLISEQRPDLVVGFGSFHCFPVLFAAARKKVPILLFESNRIPGKVIKFFSKNALFTAVYFPDAKEQLAGKTIEVEIPANAEARQRIDAKGAREALGLKADLPTLLIFGGSQGAKSINQHIIELLPLLKKENLSFQLIHLTGNDETAERIAQLCRTLNIPCHVKKFEKKMNLVWSAADVAICRSGAMTISELIHFEVPSILVPYPFLKDQHQLANALFIEKKVGGGLHFPERNISTSALAETVKRLIGVDSVEKLKMKEAIVSFKAKKSSEDLVTLITEILHA